MERYTAKSRVALAKDGKTLVAADSAEADSLFAASGTVKTEKQVKGFTGVSNFFTKEGGESEKTHEAAPSATRVISKGEVTQAKPAVIKK